MKQNNGGWVRWLRVFANIVAFLSLAIILLSSLVASCSWFQSSCYAVSWCFFQPFSSNESSALVYIFAEYQQGDLTFNLARQTYSVPRNEIFAMPSSLGISFFSKPNRPRGISPWVQSHLDLDANGSFSFGISLRQFLFVIAISLLALIAILYRRIVKDRRAGFSVVPAS